MGRFPGKKRIAFALLLGCAQVLAVGVCSAFAYESGLHPSLQSDGVPALILCSPILIVPLMQLGVASGQEVRPNLTRVLLWAVVLLLPAFAVTTWATTELITQGVAPSRGYELQLAIAICIWMLGMVLAHALATGVYGHDRVARPVVAVGGSSQLAELSLLAAGKSARFTLSSIEIGSSDNQAHIDAGRLACEVADLLKSRVRREVVAPRELINRLPCQLLVDCHLAGIWFTDYADFYERESGRVLVNAPRHDCLARANTFRRTRLQEYSSRLFDILFAAFVLALCAPLMVLVALAVRWEDGGPALYLQERVGLGGRLFKVIKFRSMRVDAELGGKPTWASEGDPRITRVGRVIRRLRIDELPQFFNVLRGDMSVIGPRPERPFFVSQLSHSIPSYHYRHAVRPGITGWAQVKFRYGASLEDSKHKLSYDLYYVKNRTMLLDASILARTIGVMLRGEGAR